MVNVPLPVAPEKLPVPPVTVYEKGHPEHGELFATLVVTFIRIESFGCFKLCRDAVPCQGEQPPKTW